MTTNGQKSKQSSAMPYI